MREIQTELKPIKMWLDTIEDGAMQQIKNIANLPFVYKWMAVMPDSHQGYGMPIGGVVALDNVISPNMVGVDIGCGMCAVKTEVKTDDVTEDQLKAILGGIRERVPVGFNKHEKQHPDFEEWVDNLDLRKQLKIFTQEYHNAGKSLGTLGGGNHFIELQKDGEGYLWLMVHSGSRNLGKKVCDYYNELAIKKMKQYYIPNVVEQDLAYLPAQSVEGGAYIDEMKVCVAFAFKNRQIMVEESLQAMYEVLGQFTTDPMINIAHNYASLENHMGKNVWVHRKGATRAFKDEVGIIPGSMGTKSYIVRGLGNPQSFMSCSHGAGRVMSRSKASQTLTEDEVNKAMEGVVFGRWSKDRKGRLDFGEAPQAYKDIDVVMGNQKDLVEIMVELKPLAVVKG